MQTRNHDIASAREQAPASAGACEPDAAAEFFDDIEAALRHRPDYRRVYNALCQTFKRCLNRKTATARITLGGDFAKTDYLLKEYAAPADLVKATNDTRVRLRQRHAMSDADMERFCLFDASSLCRFVAFVYRTDIPPRLAALLPSGSAPTFTPRLAGESLRVVVERWDDEFMYVQADETARRVCYSHGNPVYDFDWTYLKDLLYEGAQLNLVRPREADGVIYPELIIFEPDYLVNISTVARCFTNYAESPLVDLIRRFEPQRATEATVLGNFAGQLLDESIHHSDAPVDYAGSVAAFYRDNAISLLAADVSATFHQEALRQKHNIERAILVALPQQVGQFNADDGIVEPSFISEMLGLQGRMDYLQQDFKVLMEQKSGKGAFPYDNFTAPRQTDEHYVQMLLYMALVRYNYREAYEQNGRRLFAFLLYSKYSESLLGLGFAPELIFRAFRVRNRLAWAEMRYTQPDGYRLLDRLTPDRLNTKHTTGRLWNEWQRPQIAAVLDPIQQASELEKAYFFRFLTFIAGEHAMSKLGNRTKESSGFASTWHDSLEEKLAAGNIYDRLRLLSPEGDATGRVESVELGFSETVAGDMSNFRVGDIVILYPYAEGQEPDARRSVVHRCTIAAIGTATIRLRLRAAQTSGRVFVRHADSLWAIEHDFMESTYSSLYQGMHALLTAPQERRDLLLMQREPQTDTDVRLVGDYGDDFNELVLRARQAQDLFLVVGPPGTGKTSFGLLNIVREELLATDASVLLLAYTNRAVDEICCRLMAAGIDFVRIGGAFSAADEYRDKLLSERVGRSTGLADLKASLLSARVYVGTATSLTAHLALVGLKRFSLAVVDEASQILEPQLMGLLGAQQDGTAAIRKIVMIGDHKQLPAVVQQRGEMTRVDDACLCDIHLTDCRQSLFERLLKRYAHRPDVTYMLCRQGRMHHDIALFPNLMFYGGRLLEVPLSHQTATLPAVGDGVDGIADLLATRRVAFIAVEAPRDSPSDKVNLVEAAMIAAIVVRIYERERVAGFDAGRTVGVIVPYRNQIAAVRQAIADRGIAALTDITIDTVERYQGSQRRYIVYGFTVQRRYQLDFLTADVFADETDGTVVDRRLNVAMTRAEEHLLMVGNADLLARDGIFRRLIDFTRQRGSFFRVGADDFVRGRFAVPPRPDVDAG